MFLNMNNNYTSNKIKKKLDLELEKNSQKKKTLQNIQLLNEKELKQ